MTTAWKMWGTLAGLALAIGLPTLANADTDLSKSWEFMQQSMPNVPEKLLQDACTEGNLSIYHGTWTDAQKAQVEHFTERFPCIKVQRLELEATALRQRFMTEFRAKRDVADIVQDTDPGSLNEEAKNGFLAHYVISNEGSYDTALENSGFWYPLRLALSGIAWNTNLVSAEDAKTLTSWTGITDPRWAGRAGVVDPSFGGINFLPWYAWSKMFGDDVIAKIGALKPKIFGGINPAAASLAAGDIAVVLNASETGLLPLLARGAPIQWSLPEPGIGAVTGQGISAHAPHPNAARLYQEYAFTLEGYGYWQALGGAPSRINFQDKRPVASQSWYAYPKKFFTYDPADATASTPRIVDLFRKSVGSFQ